MPPLTRLSSVFGLALLLAGVPCGSQAAGGDNQLRIVTLAPHLAELVFEAGAGELLVGVSAFSDFPQAVRRLPVVGDAFLVDQEQLSLLAPDMVLAWASGTPDRTVKWLRERGFRVEVLRTRSLADVANALDEIGRLTGSQATATAASGRFRAAIAGLRETHSNRDPVRVFYQISSRPIYTVNGSHYISELIELCGGVNIFEELSELAPMISEEAVVARNPELMLTGGSGSEESGGEFFADWLRWDDMAAIRLNNLSVVDGALIGRATPRLVTAGEAVCRAIDEGRERRAAAGIDRLGSANVASLNTVTVNRP